MVVSALPENSLQRRCITYRKFMWSTQHPSQISCSTRVINYLHRLLTSTHNDQVQKYPSEIHCASMIWVCLPHLEDLCRHDVLPRFREWEEQALGLVVGWAGLTSITWRICWIKNSQAPSQTHRIEASGEEPEDCIFNKRPRWSSSPGSVDLSVSGQATGLSRCLTCRKSYHAFESWEGEGCFHDDPASSCPP